MLIIGIPAMILFFFLLGKLTSGTGADLLDWDPAGKAEQRMETDAEDTRQMLELRNRRRRAQGKPELTELDLERRLYD